MGGLLDIFDDPGIIQGLLGISPANAAGIGPGAGRVEAAMANANPQAPPQGPAPAQPQAPSASSLGLLGDPGSYFGGGPGPAMGGAIDPARSANAGPNMPFESRAAPIQADLRDGTVDPQGANYTDFAPNANMAQPPAAPGGTPPISRVSVPMPRPAGAPPAGGLNMASAGAPLPPPQAMSAGNAPPAMADGIAGAFGLNPNSVRAALAGVGRGLSAVGAQRPGASGAQSFAAGAGGGLTGVDMAQTQQQQMGRQAQNDAFTQGRETRNDAFNQKRQTQNDLFNQQSGFFKDVLSAHAQDDKEQYQQAQIQVLVARAKSVAAGRGSNAWQNTPEGRVATAEIRVAAFDSARRKSIDAGVRNQTILPEDAKAKYDELDKATEQYRKGIYKYMNIAPADAENVKTLGTKKNPFPAATMNEDEFNTRVPMGGFFKDENGDVRQRVKPPPGSDQPQTAPTGVSSYGVAPEDMMAATPVQ